MIDMGYNNTGIQWSEDMMKEKIYEIMNFYDIDRMPTHREMNEYLGSHSLSCYVSKHGGSYAVAENLGLGIKESETKTGIKYEKHAIYLLNELGFNCVHTGLNTFPYDILVDNCIKVDVKASNIVYARESKYFSANMGHDHHACDVFIFFCIEDNIISKTYIIPSFILDGIGQLSIGYDKSKYDIYLDRWDIINKFKNAFMNILQ